MNTETMAPLLESYFPPLNQCFSGSAQLISWKSTFHRVSSLETDLSESDSLYKFLSCTDVVRILSNPFSPFATPSDQSKTEFGSKTAAINASSASRAHFNLEEIKQDALWLSKKSRVDEISALRIILLEWQRRPEDQLLTEVSEEEVTSVQDAIGVTSLSKPVGDLRASSVLKREANQSEQGEKQSQTSRRLKLFQLYQSEKIHILKLSRHLLGCALRQNVPSAFEPPAGSAKKDPFTKAESLGQSIFELKDARSEESQQQTSPEKCIDAVKQRMELFAAGSGWVWAEDSPEIEVELAWQANLLEEISQAVQILFLRLEVSKSLVPSELLLSWLRLMAQYDFLESFRPSTDEQAALVAPLQSLIAITTLAFLKLSSSLSYLENQALKPSVIAGTTASKTPFFMSPDNIGEINEIFLKTASVGRVSPSPALFAWGIIMYSVREIALTTKEERELQQAQHAVDSFNNKNSSTAPSRTSEQSILEEVYEKARNPAFEENFVQFLVSSAVDRCRVLDYIVDVTNSIQSISGIGDGLLVSRWARTELLGLVRSSVEFLDYIPEVLAAALCLISYPTEHRPGSQHKQPKISCDPREIFINDSILMDKIFRVAKSRFPYEAVNFLKICRALSGCNAASDEGLPYIAVELENMETYTQLMSPGFQGYRSIREDENANFVSLIEPLDMGEIASAERESVQPNALVLVESSIIPAETVGQVVNESKPAVIMWYHKYNCLGFLGKWLEQATNHRGYADGLDEDVVTEIIGLFADLISSAQAIAKDNGTESAAKRILEMASDGLDQYGDIISVISDVFERTLQSTSSRPGSSRQLDPVISCLHFINELLSILPGRVWPFLSRSSFIRSDGKGGMLATVVSSVEATSGDFSFLLAAVRMFEALTEDAIKHVALRRTAGNVSSTSGHAAEYSAGIPSHIMRSFLLNLVRTMVEVYSSNSTWRFNDIRQQLEINRILTTSFDNILYYVYGSNDATETDSKLTGVFSSSAQYLVDILRPTSMALSFNPVLRIIIDGLQNPVSTTNLHLLELQTQLVKSAMVLSERLIRAGMATESPMSALEKQLFNALPVLIRLYALQYDYQLPVAHLIELLISHAASDPSREPPSILGHLGAQSSRRFLDSLSKFDRPFNDTALCVAVWNLLSAIVSKRQQWLGVFLLTGSSPRESLKKPSSEGVSSKMNGPPFLETSLDLLSDISSMQLRVAVSVLSFIAKAQESWPWATPQLKTHPQFFSTMLKYVSTLNLREFSPLDQCLKLKIAALLADICAIYLHSAKEARDMTFFKTLIPLVSWYSQNAVEVVGYNASLHANLKKNIEMKYPGCSLLDIKKTSFSSPELGDNYFYDIALGAKILGYNFAWTGTRGQGFVAEVERANLNLSLVEAQMTLLHSFKFFAIEHCADFMPDREVQKSMARIVRQCLVCNSQNIPNENLFCQLQQIRAEFALGLLQRLVDIRSRGSEVFELLQVAWDATRFRHPAYDSALANNDTEYYSSLLNILFLTLQFHVAGHSRAVPEAVSKKPGVSSDINIVLEIIKSVVARGIRSLTTYLHDEPQKCSPKDFALLTAILQTCLRVKDADRIYEQIAYHLANTDTPRYAATLFSWAHKLTLDGDPIYGELSILFLLELSCIPLMAEQMAVEGILSKLSTYRLTDALRQPQGCGPFDPIPRLFSIWNGGILPLCLNLVYHVGRAAPEIAAFLNQFEGQLRRASDAFAMSHPTFASSSFGAVQSSVHGEHVVRGISVAMTSEACSLALLSLIIQKFRDAGPSAGVDTQSIQELKWDKAHVKDDIEALLEKRTVLRSRIVATNEKELAMSRRAASDSSSGCQNQLEEKIVGELKMAVECIGGGDGA